MILSVRIKAKSSQEKLEIIGKKEVLVWVKAAAIEGKANKAMINLLAKELNKKKSEIEIKSGLTSKNKIVEITSLNALPKG